MTLEKLPACDNLPSGSGLLRQLGASSRGLPNVSISVPGAPPTTQPSPGNGTPQAPSGDEFFTGVTIDDPDNPEGAKILVDPESGLAFQPQRFTTAAVGPFATFQNEVTVVDDKGTVTTQRKVPLDLFLEDTLSEGGFFGDVIVGLSRGLASILNVGDTTISEALAAAGNENIPSTHIKLGLPVVDVPIVGPKIRDALLRESDVLLVTGDIRGLEQTVKALDQDLVVNPSSRQQEIEDRIRGNLEILRIQEQEEF